MLVISLEGQLDHSRPSTERGKSVSGQTRQHQQLQSTAMMTH